MFNSWQPTYVVQTAMDEVVAQPDTSSFQAQHHHVQEFGEMFQREGKKRRRWNDHVVPRDCSKSVTSIRPSASLKGVYISLKVAINDY